MEKNVMRLNLFYIRPEICYYHTGFIEEIFCGFSVFFI